MVSHRDQPTAPYQLYACFLVGLFLQFNIVPVAFHIPVPRITQLLTLPLIGFLIYTIAFSKRSFTQTIAYLSAMTILIAVHMFASGTSMSFGGSNSDLASALAFGLYLFGAVGLYLLLSKRNATNYFAWGIVIGGLLSLVAFFMQAHGMAALARTLGLAQPNQVVARLSDEGETIRLSGMWAHANQVGHVLAMVAPASGFLLLSRGNKLPTVLMAIAMLVCFNYTGNRGGVITSVLTAIAAIFIRSETTRSRRRAIVGSAIFLFIATYALYFMPLPESFYARFEHNANMDRNASGRLLTTQEALTLAIEHPFGMSQPDWRSALVQRTGFSTPHNGFFALANAMGLLFLLMFVGAQIRVVMLGLKKPRDLSLDIFLALAAFQIALSFMFEELGYTDTFMFVIALIMARVYSGAVDFRTPMLRRGPIGPQFQTHSDSGTGAATA